MNKLFGPAQIVAIALAVVGAVLQQPAIIALGAVGWIGAVAYASIKDSTKRSRLGDQAQGQDVLRPIQRLHREIKQIVTDNPDNPKVKVIGGEALSEAEHLLKRAASLSLLMDDARKNSAALSVAQDELAKLQLDAETNESVTQREALKVAIQARESEIASYRKTDQTVTESVASLKEAEVALTAIKAQLAASVASGETEDLASEGLDGMVGRLKSLATSLDEVEELRERTR